MATPNYTRISTILTDATRIRPFRCSMGRRQSVGDDGSYRLCCALHSTSTPSNTPDSNIPSGCRPSRIASTRSGASTVSRRMRET